MVLVGMGLLLTGNSIMGTVTSVQHNTFWCLIAVAFGSLQVSAIALCTKMEHLRFVLAWFAGSFWIWIATANLTHGVHASEIATVMLGITNLYAFIINLLLVKQSWK